MRSGIIAKKVGMTRLFMDNGKQVPVTVLHMENLQVVAQMTNEKHGYTAVQLGAGRSKVKNVSKAMRGHFALAKVEPKRKIAEFRVAPENLIDVGAEITAEHYVEGQFVYVSGTSKGGLREVHMFYWDAAITSATKDNCQVTWCLNQKIQHYSFLL